MTLKSKSPFTAHFQSIKNNAESILSRESMLDENSFCEPKIIDHLL
jgi:hypothetical protein